MWFFCRGKMKKMCSSLVIIALLVHGCLEWLKLYILTSGTWQGDIVWKWSEIERFLRFSGECKCVGDRGEGNDSEKNCKHHRLLCTSQIRLSRIVQVWKSSLNFNTIIWTYAFLFKATWQTKRPILMTNGNPLEIHFDMKSNLDGVF